jgi:hypothetical protein
VVSRSEIGSKPFVERLRREGDPSTRYKLASHRDAPRLAGEIQQSRRVAGLLSERGPDGRIAQHPYAKWTGAHWVLATLADLGYPRGDRALFPMRDQVLDWLLDPRRLSRTRTKYEPYLAPIRTVAGRIRIHASLEGNALYAILALGLGDERCDLLAERLLETQWEDGGWNCDRAPSASHSSFEETLLPLRGLIRHAHGRSGQASASAARRAAELLLERRLFKRRSTGRMIARDFIELHYPCYWHYDVLFALKVLAEGRFIHDERCDEAVALVRSKERVDGGFPAEAKFWASRTSKGRRSLVTWGPIGRHRSNEFVTADAVSVLALARERV